ncbi:hypothetical protein LCGC14_0333470 [marine sediment metagenome]|uniref:Histidine kinase n=1 Tax=marine sediment metagenome TaxID=412755 RepID=A0A0F9TL86_9ZZZZ
MDDQAHCVLVLEPDANDAQRLGRMIDAAAALCDLHVCHLDTTTVHPPLIPSQGPDVILLEANLASDAEMLTVAAICRSADVPVVVVTASGDPSRHFRVIAHGAADCLVKWTFNEAGLARCLVEAIHRAPRRREPAPMPQPDDSHLRRLVHHSVDAIVVLDDDGHMRHVNPAAEALFARPPLELIGSSLNDPLTDGSEVAIPRPGQPDALAITHTVHVDWDGRPARLVIFHDVTELRSKDHRLRQAIKMEAVGRLTAGVAHDFNNKLTIISGFVRVAQSQINDADPLSEALGEIARAADQSAKLVAQLLLFSRPQKPENLHSVGLNDLLTPMATSLQHLLGDGIDLQTDLPEDTGSVRVDPVLLEHTVTNLATNARDAMEGRGRLALKTANVDISHDYVADHPDAQPGEHVVLSITDTGCGMDDGIARQIFEPFFTTKPTGQGTGLGLAMVYGFVIQNDGHVTVDSAPGQGTTFHLFLPRVAAPAKAPATPAAPATPTEVACDTLDTPDTLDAPAVTVLLAEDEQAVRTLLTRVLETCGYHVISADDGAKALETADQFDGYIDVLVTDVVMPNMCGRTLAQKLRAVRPDVKVIYVSGYAGGIIDDQTAAREGAVLLQKPFSPDHLLTVVREMLEEPVAVAAGGPT